MKKAVVSGHSRGLGQAMAKELALRDWQILGIARTSTGEADVILDLSDPEAVQKWLDTSVLAEFLADADRILLVNNAGIVEPMALAGRQDAGAIVRAVDLNVVAPMLLSNAVLRLRPAGVRTQIMHISSGAGRAPYQAWSVYCASKAALDMHARCLVAEAHDGVEVVSVAPGVLDTGMQAQIRGCTEFPLKDRFAAMKQEGRLSAAGDVAAQLLTLIESESFGDPVVDDIRNSH